MLDIRSRQQDNHIDLSYYVLQHQDEMELILNSTDKLVKKAEKQQPCHLMKLLEGSINFEGVEIFVSHQIPPLFPLEPLICWSLPVVTLTSIALSLPKIQNDTVDNLLRSVSEGLVYVMLVEESLNSEDEYVSIPKVAKMLWLEVEVYRKWLGNKLQNTTPHVNTARQILEWFRDIAKNIVMEVESIDIVGSNKNLFGRCICANSMYRITETILLSYQDNTNEISQEELFMIISSMISDILAACLTNLPQVIAMKCHTSMIEKREARVQAAAQLPGETTQIINMLQARELPSLNSCDLACIDKWRTYLQHPFP